MQWFAVFIVSEVDFIGYSVWEGFAGAGLDEIMDAVKTNWLNKDHGQRGCF
jgi:hypothetical protein